MTLKILSLHYLFSKWNHFILQHRITCNLTTNELNSRHGFTQLYSKGRWDTCSPDVIAPSVVNVIIRYVFDGWQNTRTIREMLCWTFNNIHPGETRSLWCVDTRAVSGGLNAKCVCSRWWFPHKTQDYGRLSETTIWPDHEGWFTARIVRYGWECARSYFPLESRQHIGSFVSYRFRKGEALSVVIWIEVFMGGRVNGK